MQAEMPFVASEAWAQAISRELLGLKGGFYNKIHTCIIASGWETVLSNDNYNFAKNDAAIRAAVTAHHEKGDDVRPMTGYSWMVGEAYRLSAKLFGWSTVSFTTFFYIWLWGSAFLFYLAFKEDNDALNCQSLAAFSICLIIISAPHIQQLYALHNTRGWTILTLFPALHGWFACLRPDNRKILLGVAQVLLAFPACLTRPTALWLPAFLLMVFLANIVLGKNKSAGTRPQMRLILSSGMFLTAIMLSAGFAWAENSAGRKDAYTKWHSVAVGLGMSEGLRSLWAEEKTSSPGWRLVEQPQDMNAYQLVLAFLKASNRNEELNSYTVSGGKMVVTREFDWQSYERHCKEAVFWLLQKSSSGNLILLALKKCFQFLVGFWIPGWGPAWLSVPFLLLAGIYSRMIQLGRFAACPTAAPFFLILLFVTGPIVVTYPQPHGLVEGLVVYASLVLIFASLVISFVIKETLFRLGPSISRAPLGKVC